LARSKDRAFFLQGINGCYLTLSITTATICIVKVLGIDPGMQFLGYAGIENDPEFNLFKFGLIYTPRTNQTYNEFLNEGIEHIATEFPRVLMFTTPDLIVSETVPVGKLGSNSELVVASITVCKVLAYQWGIPWIDMAANTWHSEILGKSVKSTKARVRNAVFAEFPTLAEQHKLLKKEQKEVGDKPEGFRPDVTDAIGICLAGIRIHGNENLQEV